MYLLNLHTTPKAHLIKIGILYFFRKTILIEKNIRSHVLNGLNSIKFLEILNSNKTPDKFSIYQVRITFKHLSFVHGIFNVFQNTHTPGFETFKFQKIFIYPTPY